MSSNMKYITFILAGMALHLLWCYIRLHYGCYPSRKDMYILS